MDPLADVSRPRPCGSARQLEDRRRRALKLLGEGLSLNEVGRRMGCAASSVMRWFRAWHRGAERALKVRLRLLPLPLRHLHGPIIALLDNSRTHKRDPLRALRARHRRLHIEYFPSYAPELNPDEGVWSLAKRHLANGRPDNVNGLFADVEAALRRIATLSVRLRGCIEQSELPLFLH